MANDELLGERINSALRTVFAGGSSDAYNLVRELGLPPFSEFEAAMAPLLKRVTTKKRRSSTSRLFAKNIGPTDFINHERLLTSKGPEDSRQCAYAVGRSGDRKPGVPVLLPAW